MNAPDVATLAAAPIAPPHSPRAIRSVWLALTAWALLAGAYVTGESGEAAGEYGLWRFLALFALCAGVHAGIRGLLHRKHKKWLGVIGIVLALQGVGALLLLGFNVETAILTLVLWPIARFLLELIFTMFS